MVLGYFVGQKLDDCHRSKYSVLRAWKWYTMMFQISLISELFIVPVYWLFLHKVESSSQLSKDRKMHSILIHIVPLNCLVIDYIFINALAIPRRQILISVILCLVYHAICFDIYKMHHKAITVLYSIIICFSMLLIYIGILFILEFATKKKLQKLNQI